MVTTAMTIDVRSEAVTTAAQALSAAIAALDAIDPERLDDDALAATVRTVRTLGERLTARIARLSHAAVARALPEGHGARRPEVWLANLTGAAVATARRDLGVAAGLAEPRVAAAVEAGLASLDHARVLGTVTAHPAFAMHGAGLIDAAARVTPAQLTDQVELWRARHDGPVDLDARAHARRALTIRRNDDATAELWARLPTESMAVVEASLTALVDGQRTDGSERTSATPMHSWPSPEHTSPGPSAVDARRAGCSSPSRPMSPLVPQGAASSPAGERSGPRRSNGWRATPACTGS